MDLVAKGLNLELTINSYQFRRENRVLVSGVGREDLAQLQIVLEGVGPGYFAAEVRALGLEIRRTEILMPHLCSFACCTVTL